MRPRLQETIAKVSPAFLGLIPLFVLAHFGHHLLTAIAIPLSPFIRSEFALSYAQTGLIMSAFTIAYGVSQLPSGWLADRIGSRIMITIGVCGVGIAGVLVGLSQTYVLAAVFLALMGVMGGAYHPAASPIISASVDTKRRGQALGLHMIGGSASHFVAPLVAAAIAVAWGWRGAYFSLAIPTVAFGIVFYWLLGRRHTTESMARGKTGEKEGGHFAPKQLRRLVAIIVLSTFTHAVVRSSIAFIPLYMVDQFGVSQEGAAAAMALYFSAGLWASPVGGHLSDRVGAIPVLMFVCLIAGPVVYLLNIMPGIIGIGVLLVTLGAITFVRMPVSESYVVGHTPERYRSTVIGIYFFGNMEGGGLLIPLVGYLIDQIGFNASFTITGIATLIVVGASSLFILKNRD
jgi:FSR family fosmidomycin resistance protein-like MFS transporter